MCLFPLWFLETEGPAVWSFPLVLSRPAIPPPLFLLRNRTNDGKRLLGGVGIAKWTQPILVTGETEIQTRPKGGNLDGGGQKSRSILLWTGRGEGLSTLPAS